MNNSQKRNVVLSMIGLMALITYVLACTSFSPDDRRVLYPAFDPVTSRMGVAVYDRQSQQSEMLFLPVDYGGAPATNATNSVTAPWFQPQWLADGRRALIGWGKKNDGFTLLLAPITAPGSFKMFFDLPGMPSDVTDLMMTPIPLVGDYAFVRKSGTEVTRLDLRTGKLVTRDFKDSGKISLWPEPNQRKVFYFDDSSPKIFGELNFQTLDKQPLITFTNELVEGSLWAYDDRGRIAFVERAEPVPRLLVLDRGGTVFSRPMGESGEQLAWGNAMFSRKRSAILASYHAQKEAETNSDFGLMEIPLNRDPIRRTSLLRMPNHNDNAAVFFFQIAVSHDEKSAAAASTYLACDSGEEFKSADCALFFIDLSDPRRKVSRIPIPLPNKLERPSL